MMGCLTSFVKMILFVLFVESLFQDNVEDHLGVKSCILNLNVLLSFLCDSDEYFFGFAIIRELRQSHAIV